MWRLWAKTDSNRAAGRRPRRGLRFESLEKRQVLASAYQNPGQPLDVNNDTYVDQEDVRLTEGFLASHGAGSLAPTRNHPLVPFYDVDGDGKILPNDVNLLRRAINDGHALTAVKLAHDSGNKLDRVTNDVRIAGRVMNFESGGRVFAWFGEGRWSSVDITQLVRRDGSFELSIHDLHRINGRLFADGEQTFFIQSYDRLARTSGVVDYSFEIDRTGPSAFTFEPKIVEPAVGLAPSTWVVRWNHIDARSYQLRITTDAAGQNSVFAQRDITPGQSTRFVVPGLSGGTYYVFLTGFDESGNRREATGSGQPVEWVPTILFSDPPINTPPTQPIPVIIGPTIESPILNPAEITLSPEGMVYPDRWRVVWSKHAADAQSYDLRITRDAAGTDIALARNGISAHGVSATHLAAGKYYVFLTEYRSSGSVKLLDGVAVDWQPRRPGEFAITNPGLVAGSNLEVKWAAAEGAVRYRVTVYRIDSNVSMTHVIIPPGQDRYDSLYSNVHYNDTRSQETTSLSAVFQNLDAGQYRVDVYAYDAAGRWTIGEFLPANSNLFLNPGFHIFGTDYLPGYGASFEATANGKLKVDADAALYGATTVRLDFYTSADLNPSSFITAYSYGVGTFTLPLDRWFAYERVFVKVTYFDHDGTRMSAQYPAEFTTDPVNRKINMVYRETVDKFVAYSPIRIIAMTNS